MVASLDITLIVKCVPIQSNHLKVYRYISTAMCKKQLCIMLTLCSWFFHLAGDILLCMFSWNAILFTT